jgi:predicted DNA-binding WGR domain protein
MKRQFEYKEGKTHLFWEIERDGTVLTKRSWGRNRQDFRSTSHFRSEAGAMRACEKDIQFQLSRQFIEIGPGAKKTRMVRPRTDGPQARSASKKAIVRTTVPPLRALGFQGMFPKFRRVEKDRHFVVWFNWGRAGGHVNVGLAVRPPNSGTSAAQDYSRAINVRNRQRTSLRELVPHRDWKLFFFDEAAKKWGEQWPQHVASLLKARFETKGIRWLEDPARRPGRGARIS